MCTRDKSVTKTLFALTVSSFFLLPLALADTPEPGSVNLRGLATGGNGCPQGSVTYEAGLDFTNFSVQFDSYVAEAGPGVPPSSARKFCTLNLDIAVPVGWQYAIKSIDYHGQINLDSGAIATQKSIYSFIGENREVTFASTTEGPYSSDYMYHDYVGESDLLWSACGIERALKLKTEIKVSATGNANALMSQENLNLPGGLQFGLAWRKCLFATSTN